MSNEETPKVPGDLQPEPAREALTQPHLPAEELESEIGDSEPWDEDSVSPDDKTI